MENQNMNIPNHIAIILDGNGRWAKKHFLPRNAGHAKGSKTVEKMCEECDKVGIKYLTVYAFSTENWSRPEKEVMALMDLLRKYLSDCIERSMKNNMRIRVIGDVTPLDDDLKNKILEVEEVSKNNTGLNFTVALNYGGRDEITRAMRELAVQVKEGNLKPEDITIDMVSNHLDTKDIPDPDLLIRTSGEERLSNFLPWQLAYTEFYFTKVLWPDFGKRDLMRAIEHYNKRERRFGGI